MTAPINPYLRKQQWRFRGQLRVLELITRDRDVRATENLFEL